MTQNGFRIGECSINLSIDYTGNTLKEATMLKLDIEDVMSDWNRMVRFDALQYYKADIYSPSNQTSNSNNGSSTCVSPISSLSRSSFNDSKCNMKYNLENVQFRGGSTTCTSTFSFSSSITSSGKSFKFHETRFASKTKPVVFHNVIK